MSQKIIDEVFALHEKVHKLIQERDCAAQVASDRLDIIDALKAELEYMTGQRDSLLKVHKEK